MRRIASVCIALSFLISPASAQRIISTVAGTDWIFNDNGKPATQAALGHIAGIVTDSGGNIYIADNNNNLVFKVDTRGILTVIAGNGIAAFSGDGGQATRASLNAPVDVALDPAGNLYIADNNNRRVRKVDARGIITTYAGSGQPLDPANPAAGQDENVPATQASMAPVGLYFDSKGMNLYVADADHNKVRKIDGGGRIATIAGNGDADFNGDNQPATRAALSFPRGMVLDSAGNLYIADALHSRIRKVDTTGIISTVMGLSQSGSSPAPDGTPAANAPLNVPFALAFDKAGNLYVGDVGNSVVQVIAAATGTVRTVAGTGAPGFSGDGGPATAATFNGPGALAFDPSGNLLISDGQNSRLRRIANAVVTTLAGNGLYKAFPDASPAVQGFLSQPAGLALDGSGNLYLADAQNNRVRKITPDGRITLLAGTGDFAFRGDGGPAVSASLAFPTDVAVDAAGNVYIADAHNARVRQVTPDGIITTAACGQLLGSCGPLVDPRGLAVAPDGSVYIADGVSNVVRQWHPQDGSVTGVAGSGDTQCGGDGGPALQACLSNPQGVAVDAAGNLYIADTGHHTIREVTADGNIQTIAGNGQGGYAGDGGPAANASLNGPARIALGQDGSLYIADTGNHVVRVVAPDGTIATLAGTGATPGFAGDGSIATSALLNAPSGVATDAAGNVYISDTLNNRIRLVSVSTPSLRTSGVMPATGLLFLGVAPESPAAPPVATPPQVVQVFFETDGRPSMLPFSVTSDVPWLRFSPAAGTSPAAVQVTAVPSFGQSGNYSGNIQIAATGFPNTDPIRIAVTFTVAPPVSDTPVLVVDRTAISLAVTPQAPAATALIQLQNTGSGAPAISVTTSGEPWLKAAASASTVAKAAPVLITLHVDLSGRAAGSYRSTLTISWAGSAPIKVPITVVSAVAKPTLSLSRATLSFTAVAGGATRLPPQSFTVLNRGSGGIAWTLARCGSLATCGAAGSAPPAWLNVDTSSGSTGPAGSRVNVSVNPSGLAAGRYQGLLQVAADGVLNSPQFVSVLLNVVPPAADPGPAVTPATLVFTAGQNGTPPGSQSILVYNTGAAPLQFNVFGGTLDGGNWLVSKVPQPPLNPDQPLEMVVQTDPTGLNPGLYRGVFTFLFQTGAIRNVAVDLLVAPSPSSAPASVRPRDGTSGCVPDTSVQPVITALGTGTRIPAGVPTVVDAQVTDPGGCPLTTGDVSVQAIDSPNMPTVNLVSLGNGVWEGVFHPETPGKATVVAAAADPNLGVSGTSDPVPAEIDPPLDGLLAVANVVSTASLLPGPVAPGSAVSILGSNLGPRASLKQNLPWDTQLGGVSVRLGGVLLPVAFVSQNQLNTVVPFAVQAGSVPQLVIAYQGSLSLLPLPVSVTDTQPAIYSQDGSGAGLGQISNAGGVITGGHPARSGDQITIRCSGLGAVSPAIAAGVPVPASPAYNVVQPVSVTIGGTAATFVSATLAPGSSGDYNVVAVVPALSPGTYNVTVAAGGSASAPVQLAVQ